jgi:hypothetical protein
LGRKTRLAATHPGLTSPACTLRRLLLIEPQTEADRHRLQVLDLLSSAAPILAGSSPAIARSKIWARIED